MSYYLHIYLGFICSLIVSVCSFLTPILFIVLPRLSVYKEWRVSDCGLECEGLLIGIAFKMFVLLMGAWAMLARRPRSLLPRMLDLRAILLFFMCIMNFSFWLFFAVRIMFEQIEVWFWNLQLEKRGYKKTKLFTFYLRCFNKKVKHLFN